MHDLPIDYLNNMQEILKDEFEDFLHSYERPSWKGIRFNTNKARPETIEKLVKDWSLTSVPWCNTGYYYESVRPGLSLYHDAGVFYMQEPSAMCVAEHAGITKDDLVLDLCAAPGGKSTAAAEKCYCLLSNEIIPQRARILSSNIERMGFINTIVSSASPDRLSDIFPGYFDIVIADAPCSGEGMMRKDPVAIEEWSADNVRLCTERQEMILEHACLMVRPGGKLVYSTCTFEVEENEHQINRFLERHTEYKLQSMHRFWPHLEKGEGHFICVLSNGDITPSAKHTEISFNKELQRIEKRLSSSGVHILRTGLQKGETFIDKKGNKVYEPSHAEIMASVFDSCTNGINLKSEELALSFLNGNVLRLSEGEFEFKGEDGFCGIYYDGYPLGLGKKSGFTVKNHLPKGLRRLGG